VQTNSHAEIVESQKGNFMSLVVMLSSVHRVADRLLRVIVIMTVIQMSETCQLMFNLKMVAKAHYVQI
jgi:hypothetical protein